MIYIGLPLVQTFLKDVLGSQPWHLSIFGKRVEDKGAPCWIQANNLLMENEVHLRDPYHKVTQDAVALLLIQNLTCFGYEEPDQPVFTKCIQVVHVVSQLIDFGDEVHQTVFYLF